MSVEDLFLTSNILDEFLAENPETSYLLKVIFYCVTFWSFYIIFKYISKFRVFIFLKFYKFSSGMSGGFYKKNSDLWNLFVDKTLISKNKFILRKKLHQNFETYI